MKRPLKVMGGSTIVGGRQFRIIVSGRTQREMVEALTAYHGYQAISPYSLRLYWSETGNTRELELARANPGQVIEPDATND